MRTLIIHPPRHLSIRASVLSAFLLIMFTLLTATSTHAENELRIRHDDIIESYGINTLRIDAPAAGSLTITVRDDYSLFRTLRQNVIAGENIIQWNGLRDDGQRLGIFNGTYVIDAVLTCPDGSSYAASAQAEGKSRQALLYVLPSSSTLYLDGERWFAEAGTVKEGGIIMAVSTAQDPDTMLMTRRYSVSDKGVGRLQWSGIINGNKVSTGQYLLRYWAEDNPDISQTIEVTVKAGAPPIEAIAPTGPVMPEPDMDDAALWALLQKPRIVANVQNLQRQKIYESPSRSSSVLGTLFGQTQGVEVLAVEGDWAQIRAWQHEDVIQVTGYVPLKILKIVYPNGPYGLVIDKKAQTLTLFENGVRVTTIQVSTGLPTAGKPYRETAPGAFLTDEHIGAFTSDGSNYAYPIRYDGDNFLHQLGYRVRDRHADYSIQQKLLGSKASHGCIRLPDHPLDDSGVDAFWLWTHLPWHTPILILDD